MRYHLPAKTKFIALSDQPQKLNQVKPKKEYRETEKFSLWVKYYTDPQEKDTYGNKTQSAIKAYNLDPVEQYHSAKTIGWENFTKLDYLGADHLETKGLSFSKMMDFAVSKMFESKDHLQHKWWVSVMETAKYKQTAKQEINVNNNTQNNTVNVELSADEAKQFDEAFTQFLETKKISPK